MVAFKQPRRGLLRVDPVAKKKRRIEENIEEGFESFWTTPIGTAPRADGTNFPRDDGSFSFSSTTTTTNNSNTFHSVHGIHTNHPNDSSSTMVEIEGQRQDGYDHYHSKLSAPTNITTDDPTVFRRTVTVGDPNAATHAPQRRRQLHLLVLGCESKAPYGPFDHTASLFLDLITQALHKCLTQQDEYWDIVLKVYQVEKGEYPATGAEWDQFDGVLLPGSFSSAYDNLPWIARLKEVVQQQIVARRKPTLGICFGHQIFAQSFEDGDVGKTPTGCRCGRRTMEYTPEGSLYLNSTNSNGQQQHNTVDLFFTHNDMVRRLPAEAVCLGGSVEVPIESAAYFGSEAEASAVRRAASSPLRLWPTHVPRPYAVTFQAHPECAASLDLGMYRTLELVMDASVSSGSLDNGERIKAGQDARRQFHRVRQQSVDLMVSTGRLLGWFP